VRLSGLSVPWCLAKTDLVGYGAGVAQLAERLICNHAICRYPLSFGQATPRRRTASNVPLGLHPCTKMDLFGKWPALDHAWNGT